MTLYKLVLIYAHGYLMQVVQQSVDYKLLFNWNKNNNAYLFRLLPVKFIYFSRPDNIFDDIYIGCNKM